MSENMTLCPDCGTEFDTIGEETSLPIQVLDQACPDCEYEVQVAIINYPPASFEVVAPALKGDTCGTRDCGADAMIRRQKIGRPIEGRCAEHIGAHREAALDHRSEL